MPWLPSDFAYDLPKSLIAQVPTKQRTASRLLTLDRATGLLSHHHFGELPQLLRPGDVLVRNQTRVIPARLYGQKNTGGQVEILLIRPIDSQQNNWEALTKPGLKVGQSVKIVNPTQPTLPTELQITCLADLGYTRQVQLQTFGRNLDAVLNLLGHTPIPPYIHTQWSETKLRQRYQTTYARNVGSVAAPTAGLHFTTKLDQLLETQGITIAPLTLHVGLGTFQPVTPEQLAAGQLHKEQFTLPASTTLTIRQALQTGQRVIAVGTTSLRALESAADVILGDAAVQNYQTETTLFVRPPYQFRIARGLITNFHLPESSLLMLVSAFVSAPNTEYDFENFKNSTLGQAYLTAIEKKYRFFSFGDAMLIT